MENLKKSNCQNKILYVMVGIPGAGKSTYAKAMKDENVVYVSRDEVRLSLIGENDEYFSKEKAVFREFVKRIQTALDEGKNVIADASHVSKASRAKLANNLNLEGVEYVVLNMLTTPIEVCLKRNAQRTGRACVPEDSIRSMKRWSSIPKLGEEYIDRIINIEYTEEN